MGSLGVEVVPGGGVVDEREEPVTLEFVGILDSAGGLYESWAHATPRGMPVDVAVDAVEHTRRALSGGMVLSARAADVNPPFAVACEVTWFDALTTEAATSFLTELLDREVAAVNCYAVHDGCVRSLGGGELEDKVGVLLSSAAFVDRLDPVRCCELVGLPAVDCLKFT